MPPSQELAHRVRLARLGCGFTLEALADRTGISKSHLSRIESGSRQPSLMALTTIAAALATTASDLLGADPDGSAVVFTGGASTDVTDGSTITPLGRLKGGTLESFRVRLPTQPGARDLLSHTGEHCVYVLEGTLRLHLGDAEHTVVTGDVAHFDAETPHAFEPGDDAPVELLLVTTGGEPFGQG